MKKTDLIFNAGFEAGWRKQFEKQAIFGLPMPSVPGPAALGALGKAVGGIGERVKGFFTKPVHSAAEGIMKQHVDPRMKQMQQELAQTRQQATTMSKEWAERLKGLQEQIKPVTELAGSVQKGVGQVGQWGSQAIEWIQKNKWLSALLGLGAVGAGGLGIYGMGRLFGAGQAGGQPQYRGYPQQPQPTPYQGMYGGGGYNPHSMGR